MKKFILLIISTLFIIGVVGNVHAISISEPVITNPASTDDLWAYSYLNYDSNIHSETYYTTNLSTVSNAIFEGYLTGNTHPTADVDYFTYHNATSRGSRVFTTYIQSSINQTVLFSSDGDDGHAIFINNVFIDGGGYTVDSYANLNMVAGNSYKLTTVSNNFTGPTSMWFNVRGDQDSNGAYRWSSTVAGAPYISMNAVGDFNTTSVPEPATIILLTSALLGLGIIKRKIR